MIWKTNRLVIDPANQLKRVPPRQPIDRQKGYLDDFDFTTVFSDIFVRDGRVWMIGPPFLNLEADLLAANFIWNWVDVTSEVKFERYNRMSRTSFPTTAKFGELEIRSELGHWMAQVSTFDQKDFDGARLMITQQKNNRLEWIAYWALFNVRVNGIDSIVIYDNGSTDYPIERVEQLLSLIPGLKRWIVVDWDTPHGVTGGPNSVWDSDYGQLVAWEHSRHMFANLASSVLMIDVDELPVTQNPKGILEQLDESDRKAILFNRISVKQYANRDSGNDGIRVHSDFSLGDSSGAQLSSKYAYAPARLDDTDQLLVHQIRGESIEAQDSTETFAGHFDAIRIEWREKEKEPVRVFQQLGEIDGDFEENPLLNDKFLEIEEEWSELMIQIRLLVDSQTER